MIITKTPLRISLGGGGTDLPFYCDKYGADLIFATVNKYIYVMINKRLEKNYKISYETIEINETSSNIHNSIVREALKLLEIEDYLEIISSCEIPSGTGLGSSHTFTVGLLNALYMYKGINPTKHQLAEDASHICMDILNEPCGRQDQYAAAYGGINNLIVETNKNTRIIPLNISNEVQINIEKSLLFFFTGIQRASSVVLADQSSKERSDKNIEFYHQIKEIGINSRTALQNGDIETFGKLLHKHWILKKQTSNIMSTSTIDQAYLKSMDLGAYGGKIVGAGGGGFLMVCTDKNKSEIIEEMRNRGLIYYPLSFEFEGSKLIFS